MVEFVSFRPEDDPSLFAGYLDCYRAAYSGSPWREWMKCSKCGQYWGTEDTSLLASWNYLHCGVPLVDFWPHHEVAGDARKEIVGEALCTLAIDADKQGVDRVIGLCVGYPIRVPDLEKKVGIEFAPTLERLFGPHAMVGYMDEIAVRPKHRGFTVGKELNRRRIEAFVKSGVTVAVSRARRTPKPSVTFSWYTGKLGFQILAEYPSEDGRVILGHRDVKSLANRLAL